MGMRLDEIRAEVAALATSFDPSSISPAEAERVVADATAVVNMLDTIRALAARRAADGGGWRRDGARSPSHDLARKTGAPVSKAKELLAAAEQLSSLPTLEHAARTGAISASQLGPIASASTADPNAEERLVAKARRASLGELLDDCARTRAFAQRDADARHRAIHAGRYLRHQRCADGAGELRYRSTVDEVAEVLAVVRGHANRQFDLARLEARHEPEEAYLADGLLAACRASTASGTEATPTKRGRVRSATPTKVVVRIDWDALVRGWPIDGEVSEVAGVGPVPVSVVRAMVASGDAFLAGVVTKGVDVHNVFHLGRRPTAHQATALDWQSPGCTTEGCNGSVRLETDHREDWARTKVTLLRWLERHCEHCHALKTNHGWALVTGQGKRPLVPPEDPRHPGSRRAAAAEPRAG